MESAFGASHRPGPTSEVLPASQYLQEKLQERRARNLPSKRARQSDFGSTRGRDDDIFLNEAEESKHAINRTAESTPLANGSQRCVDVGGSTRRRALGVKDVDEHMDRLTKQNFALKLELDHRREHTAKLQEQIEAMRAQADRAEQLQDEHSELLRINSQLVEELEKRDKAVEEAMDLICELEDQVVELQERSSATRPSTAHADSGYAGTETHEQVPPSSPPEQSIARKTAHVGQRQPPPSASAAASRFGNVLNGQGPARVRREPLAMSQKKPSTRALRSVYLESVQSLRPVQSFNSIVTRQEGRVDDDEQALNSPRLSVLSESSFPSLYSPKKNISPDRLAWEAEDVEPLPSARSPSSHLRQDSIKRVSQWMEARDGSAETPSKSNEISPPLLRRHDINLPLSPSKRPGDDAEFLSLGGAFSPTSKAAEQPSRDVLPTVSYIKPFPIRTGRQMARPPQPATFAGQVFGEPLLPPTPNSVSTEMLRESRASIGASAAEGRLSLDTTPTTVKGYDPLEPNVRPAPKQMRSSMETNTTYEGYAYLRNDDAYQHDELDKNDTVDTRILSQTAHGLKMDYDGFPDGSSLSMGTPRRFFKPSKSSERPSLSTYDSSPTFTTPPQRVRRMSGSEGRADGWRPSLSRAETSPTVFGMSIRAATGRSLSSAGSVTSPRSYNSGSSSNRTIMQPDRNRSAELNLADSYATANVASASPPRSRRSASPPRSLTQRAQGLLRRLSQKDSQTEREKSPLPTLTRTPSSAYLVGATRDTRRPGTSLSGAVATAQPGPRLPSSALAGTYTPSNMPARPVTASSIERPWLDKERRNPFKRTNSTKKWPDTSVPASDKNAVVEDGTSTRGGIWTRRGSFREALGSVTRRPLRT